MAKQLNSYQVNLAFTADTESAKRQLQDLQTRLSNLTAGKRIPGMELGITKDIQEGISAAAQLKVQLEQATNVKTGKLDLTKFSQSLKDSNMSIDKYANSLKNLGPQGQEAFLQLTRSISSAEVPLLHVNEKLNEMWVTLKNTARWQISSSILHGFMGAVQSAYGYAQDLNESLNNIRIVSGQSTEQMARFADQANKAAKALSTTTTEYTNASLIYYQQGLSDAEVQARTDITVKMAQASGQSAEIVSDQLTALWNNFYDGSQSLEHFADVLTKLGAETASSSDEISAGLEKFAAIGDMIGLSYDNAAAALATVTAQTRQSADVVGTAFKTIFARIQGLSLGETLEDGTDLNKYSEALSKVGISIFEQNGELKDMDNIIAEMGAKWKTLSKDQQIALSQTVAGVRQYNQLVAFMDNFDYYEKLLDSAQNAEGALQEQANIRAESWEAASDRVQAAMEALYQDILDDEFFIDVLNGVEKVLTGVDDLIDGLGGIKPILTIISALFLKTFSGKIVSSIKSVKDGIVSIANPEKAKQKAIATRQESIDAGTQLINDISPDSKWGEVKRQGLTQEYAIQQSLLDNAGKITLEKQKEYQIRLDSLNLMQSELEVSAKKLDKDKASYEEQKRRQLLLSKQDTNDYSEDEAREYLLKNEQMGQIVAFENQVRAAKNAKDPTKAFDKIKERIQNATTVDGNALNLNIDFDKEVQDLDSLQAKLNGIFDELFVQTEAFENIPSSIEAVGKAAHDTAKEMVELNVQGENVGSQAEKLQNDINGSAEALTDWRTGLVDIAGNVTMLVGSLTALGSAWSELETSIQEGDISGAAGSLVAMASVLPMVSGGISALLGTLKTVAPTMVATNAATGALSLSLKGLSLSVPWLTVIATALTILLPKILELIPTTKKARESIQEATQAYEEQKQVVDDLNNTLQTTKEKIDELNNKDTLTVIEQEELEKLKQEQAYLERQLALEEKIEKERKAAAVKDITDNYKTAYQTIIEDTPRDFQAYTEINEFGEQIGPDEWYNSLSEQEQKLNSNIQKLNEWKRLNSENYVNWADSNKESLNAMEADYQTLLEGGASKETIKAFQEDLALARKNFFSEGEYFNLTIKPVFESEAFQKSKDDLLESLHADPEKDFTFSKDIEKQLRLAGINAEEFSTQLKQIYTNADEVLKTVEAPADFIKSLSFEDLQIINENNFDTTEFDEFYRKFLEVKNQKESLVLNIQIARDTAKDALNTLASGDFLSEEQLTNLQEHFKDLYDLSNLVNMSMYDQARIISSALLNATIPEAAINNTINKVGELQEQLNVLNETESELTDEEKLLKIELEAELDQAKKDIEALTSEPINLSVEIDNSLIEGLKAQAGAIDKATSLITEGFKVEAKNVSELMKTMPQLFEDATVDIKTGVVQLQQDIVNSAIETAKTETEVERQGLIERLNARIVYLNGSIDSLNKLRTVAEANSDATKLKEEINSKLTLDEKKASAAAIVKAKIQQAIQEQTQSAKAASHAIQDQQHVTDASKIESETLYQNWQDALKEFNQAAYSAFSNAQAYQSAFINNQPVGRLTLDAKSSITGKSSSSTYQWDYNDGQENKYSNLQAFVDAGFDFSKIEGLDQSNDIAVQVYANQIQEQWKDLFNIDLNGKALWGGAEGFTDQFFDMYETAEALGIDTNLSINDLQYELAEAIAQLSDTSSFNGALEGLKKAGTTGNGKDKYTPEVERYHEITRAIENQERALDDLSNAKDEAFGASKISLMEQELTQMEALKVKQQQLLDEAEKYLALDKAALMSAYPGAKIDANTGEILNFEELQRNTTSEEQNKILEQYESTIDKINEAKDALQELDRQIKDMNYEKLNYQLELKFDIEDSKMKKLEYLLNTFSDNFFKRFEALALMWDNEDNVISQFDVYKNKLNAYGVYDSDKKEVSSEGGYVADLTAKYEAGDISQAKYIEGLKNAEDAIYEQLEALNELDQTMLTYYGETIDAANEELDDHTDHLEHLTSVFDHYMNLMDILGKSKDYEAMGNFLQGKADTLRDQLEVQQDWVAVLVKQEADAKKALDEAIADGDEAAVELLKKNWDAARDALDEAQDEMLSMTEEWAEAMKAVTENNMKKIADTLEKTLTSGSTFETMMDSFDKLNKRQEEYLTKTNQIYETNKLMRTASKALDETDNKVAKTKLQNFIDETKSLQENTKLSQYELDIQQAKYDLLLAEIALEEAQNAKSTVRLSRDSEGNFGYVYTADQDKIDDAQQAVDDADNRLYNLSLEGQQEYTQKYLEAQEALYGELTALQEAWLNGEIANEEEYELRKAEILNHYFGPDGVLSTYQNLYNIAVRTDAKATEDYWGKEYALMTQDTEDWKIAVDQYLKDIETETKNWQEVSTKANEDVGEALSNSKDATEDLSTESENLKKTIVENVIPGLESELEAVQDLTEEYGNNRQAILDMIEAYEEYLETIGQEIENQSNSVSYDKNTDYNGLMQGYLAAGGKKGDANWNQLEAQREAKIVGEGYTKDYYVTKVGDSDYNIQSSNAYYVDKEAVDKKLKELGIDPEPYATGGYTGAWGPEGKLAVLHEKELVLNAKDTENLLTTVSFIRDLVNMIDAQAGMASLFNMYATSGVMSNSESLEQVVTIHAEFPNASDRYEIEEAFNSLVNRASQYANRK